MENTESTESTNTHLVHYVVIHPHHGVMGYGEFDVTLPAGWTKANKNWCKAEIGKDAPSGAQAVITGVTEYRPVADLAALRNELAGLAADLVHDRGSIATGDAVAAKLRAIAARLP